MASFTYLCSLAFCYLLACQFKQYAQKHLCFESSITCCPTGPSRPLHLYFMQAKNRWTGVFFRDVTDLTLLFDTLTTFCWMQICARVKDWGVQHLRNQVSETWIPHRYNQTSYLLCETRRCRLYQMFSSSIIWSNYKFDPLRHASKKLEFRIAAALLSKRLRLKTSLPKTLHFKDVSSLLQDQ